MKGKRKTMKRSSHPNHSSSSSSSSSCIESPSTKNSDTKKRSLKPRNKPTKKRVRAKKAQPAADTSATSPKSRSSIYRGVTRHRLTGRYEAHLWDKTTWNSLQNKRGRQIYLGAYDDEKDAARTYDLAALKYWGTSSVLNFPVETYSNDIEEMQKMSKEEFLASMRRRSSGFSRGVSKYRGVARHHHNGRWEARIGRVAGNKYLYLGTYSTQEEAAAAYDRAAIEFRGPKAVTNFDINNYADKLEEMNPELQLKQQEFQVKPEIVLIPDNELKSDEKIPELQSNFESEDLIPSNDKEKASQIYEEVAQVQTSIPKLELIDPVDSRAMDIDMEVQDHPWDLCLDTTGFSSLEIPELPLDKASEFLGFLDDNGFEDDIECIFDGSPFNGHDPLGDDRGECNGDGMEGRDSKGNNDDHASPSPSSSSTMTSI